MRSDGGVEDEDGDANWDVEDDDCDTEDETALTALDDWEAMALRFSSHAGAKGFGPALGTIVDAIRVG
jgi:hypothetical protein